MLLRLVVATAFLAVMVVVIGSWRAPFRFRVGDYVPDGILASVDFKRVDLRKTELAQVSVEEQVPFVYRHDSTSLRSLSDDLRRHLFEVAAATEPMQLSAEARTAFGFLSEAPDATARTADLQKQWETLKTAVGPSDTAERSIDELLGEFDRLIAPLQQTGVLDESEVSKRDLRLDGSIAVVSADGEEQIVPVADVLMSEMLKGSGRLGRFWKSFPELAPLQPVLDRWLAERTKPTLVFDEPATLAAKKVARESTPAVEDQFSRGAVLIPPGAVIDPDTLEILKAQYETLERAVSPGERMLRVVTVLVLLTVLWILNAYYLIRNQPKLVNSLGRLTTYLSAICLSVALGRLMSADPWHAEVIPLLCTVMILAIAYNQVLGAITGFSLSLLQTFAMGGGVGEFIVLMSVIATSVVLLNQVSSRSKIVKVGLITAAVYLLVTWGIGVVENQRLQRLWTDQQLLFDSLRGAGWCLAAGYLVAGSLPFIEQSSAW